MVIAGLALAGVAALLHVYIFYMESIAWTSAKVRATFGTTEDEARATKEMAFNQGFYNLFLAIATAVGIILHVSGLHAVGIALLLSGVGSMFAAALVLFLSSPDKRGAAVKQGAFPLLAIVLLILGIAL
jgi:putative membrane protein